MRKNSTRAKLPTGWLRRTFIISDKHSELLDRAAFWEHKQIKVIIYEALEAYFKGKKHKSIPNEKKPWE